MHPPDCYPYLYLLLLFSPAHFLVAQMMYNYLNHSYHHGGYLENYDPTKISATTTTAATTTTTTTTATTMTTKGNHFLESNLVSLFFLKYCFCSIMNHLHLCFSTTLTQPLPPHQHPTTTTASSEMNDIALDHLLVQDLINSPFLHNMTYDLDREICGHLVAVVDHINSPMWGVLHEVTVPSGGSGGGEGVGGGGAVNASMNEANAVNTTTPSSTPPIPPIATTATNTATNTTNTTAATASAGQHRQLQTPPPPHPHGNYLTHQIHRQNNTIIHHNNTHHHHNHNNSRHDGSDNR